MNGFNKTGEKPLRIMTADGTWHEADRTQFFQESERGQSWELWQAYTDGRCQFIKRFPKRRVLIVSTKS